MGIDPVSIGLEAAGVVMGAIGKIAEGNAQAAADRYQAQVAQNNAIIARQNAQYAGQAGEAEAYRQGVKNKAVMGAIMAGQGANNIDVNSGSAVAVQASQRETGLLDALTIRSNAARQAYGYQTQATNFDAQSELDKSEASSAEEAGWIGGLTSILGGGGQVMGEWEKYKLANPGSNGVDTYLLQPGLDAYGSTNGMVVGGGYAGGYGP